MAFGSDNDPDVAPPGGHRRDRPRAIATLPDRGRQVEFYRK